MRGPSHWCEQLACPHVLGPDSVGLQPVSAAGTSPGAQRGGHVLWSGAAAADCRFWCRGSIQSQARAGLGGSEGGGVTSQSQRSCRYLAGREGGAGVTPACTLLIVNGEVERPQASPIPRTCYSGTERAEAMPVTQPFGTETVASAGHRLRVFLVSEVNSLFIEPTASKKRLENGGKRRR